jgi:hypothetical protein
MPGCRGKCEIQITRILTDPIQAAINTDPANAPLPNPWATKADCDAASDALKAKVQKWAGRVPTTACNAALGCVCNQTDNDPTDAEWDTKKTLTRDFGVRFTSGGSKYTAIATVEYKIAYVAGACEDPPGAIFLVGSFGHLEGLGVSISADSDLLTAERLDEVKKALS